jgi:catechol 2,3-dioxygenase-like lactoylglutathione lyase family enzyme
MTAGETRTQKDAVTKPRGIEHVGVTVPDYAQAVRFFEEAFGATALFSLVRRGETPLGAVGLGPQNGLHAGTAIIAITMIRLANGPDVETFEIDRPRRRETSGAGDIGISHFSLTIDDIDATTARFEKTGGTLLEGPYDLFGQETGPGNRDRIGLTPWGPLTEFERFAAPFRCNAEAREERWLPPCERSEE